MTRSEPCVCTGRIEAPDGDWDAIREAVAVHNATPQHTAWRLGMRLVRSLDTWSRDGLGVQRMTYRERRARTRGPIINGIPTNHPVVR